MSETLRAWALRMIAAVTPASPPTCTGTLNKDTGQITNTPCIFRDRTMSFPQVFQGRDDPEFIRL